MGEINSDIINIINSIKSDIADIKSDITDIKSDIKSYKPSSGLSMPSLMPTGTSLPFGSTGPKEEPKSGFLGNLFRGGRSKKRKRQKRSRSRRR
jgi:hypothetical protein